MKQESTRKGFGKGLLKAGKREDVWVVTADLGGSTCVNDFKKTFSERFVQVGVAEQNLVTVASGIASMGKVVFATSFAAFSPGRNWEQIRTTIAYNDQPVIVVGSHTGLGVGEDGATHQALEDVALMRAMPNMLVVVPCDAIQAEKATIALAKQKKPAYLRLNRQKTPIITSKEKFELGKAQILKQGKDIAIFSCGPIINTAMKASEELRKKGYSASIINVHTIKPLDKKTILQQIRKCKTFLVIEDHQIIGGLGSAITEVTTKNYPVKGKLIGMKDEFGESGTAEELYKKHGLTHQRIITEALNLIKQKSKETTKTKTKTKTKTAKKKKTIRTSKKNIKKKIPTTKTIKTKKKAVNKKKLTKKKTTKKTQKKQK